MKWITLKSKNLPIIALEIDRAIEVFTGLLDRAESLGNAEDRAEVESLRQDLQIRINQLNHYYTDHSLDDNIAIFHMLKLKLEKTLFLSRRSNSKNTVSSKVEQFEAQSSLFQEGDIKWLDQPLFAYYENSPRKKQSLEKKASVSHNTANERKEQKINTYKTQQSKRQQNPKTSIKPQPKFGGSGVSKKQVPAKKPPPPQIIKFKPRASQPEISGIQTPAFGEQALNPVSLLEQMGRSSQLKFTIKMTKQEYRQLLQLKKQMKQPAKM